MKKQFWVICNEQEQRELLSRLLGYEIQINDEKYDFPLVIDTETKMVYRCASVSCCAAQTAKNGKIQNYVEMHSVLQKEQIITNEK